LKIRSGARKAAVEREKNEKTLMEAGWTEGAEGHRRKEESSQIDSNKRAINPQLPK
jgi:hypothetical protein